MQHNLGSLLTGRLTIAHQGVVIVINGAHTLGAHLLHMLKGLTHKLKLDTRNIIGILIDLKTRDLAPHLQSHTCVRADAPIRLRLQTRGQLD